MRQGGERRQLGPYMPLEDAGSWSLNTEKMSSNNVRRGRGIRDTQGQTCADDARLFGTSTLLAEGRKMELCPAAPMGVKEGEKRGFCLSVCLLFF